MLSFSKLIAMRSFKFAIRIFECRARFARIFAILAVFCATNFYISEAIAFSSIDVSTDSTEYTTGSTFTLNLSIENSTPATLVDVYLSVVLPDQSLLFLQLLADGSITFVPGTANPADWVPLTRNLNLTQGFSVADFPLFVYQFLGTEPVGQYTWIVALTTPGTTDVVGDTGVTSFTFLSGDGGGQPLYIPSFQSFGGSLCANDEVVVNAQTLMAFGGTPLSGYTWTLSNTSTYPAGTTVDALTGIFHGNGGGLIAGTHDFSMTVSDGSQTATGNFSFTVDDQSAGICGAAIFQQSNLAAINLPDAETGFGYGASLFATLGDGFMGATRPLTWELDPTGNPLPEGLSIDPSRGVIRGTPFTSASGQYAIRIIVTDSNGIAAICGNAGGCPLYIINLP